MHNITMTDWVGWSSFFFSFLMFLYKSKLSALYFIIPPQPCHCRAGSGYKPSGWWLWHCPGIVVGTPPTLPAWKIKWQKYKTQFKIISYFIYTAIWPCVWNNKKIKLTLFQMKTMCAYSNHIILACHYHHYHDYKHGE